MNPIARIRDYLLEREIRRLASECSAAVRAGHRNLSRALYRRMVNAILRRSPAQWDRIERSKGLRIGKQA